jgi:hypothetical protein
VHGHPILGGAAGGHRAAAADDLAISAPPAAAALTRSRAERIALAVLDPHRADGAALVGLPRPLRARDYLYSLGARRARSDGTQSRGIWAISCLSASGCAGSGAARGCSGRTSIRAPTTSTRAVCCCSTRAAAVCWRTSRNRQHLDPHSRVHVHAQQSAERTQGGADGELRRQLLD